MFAERSRYREGSKSGGRLLTKELWTNRGTEFIARWTLLGGFAIGAAVLFLFLYLVKPGMRQKKNRKQIVWKKFALVYSLSMICFGVLLFTTYAVAGKHLHNAQRLY